MDSDQGKLFLGGISWDTDEEKLKDYFGSYGEVLQAVVMRDKMTGKPRGFAFVVFADPSVVDRVLENDRHVIDGRAVEAKRALSREEQVSKVGNSGGSRNYGGGGNNTRTKKIFVGGLPPTLNEEGFRQYFEAYGAVTDVVIMYDQQTNRPRGFGFVSFDSEEAVDNVLHKTFHDLNGKQVEVKRALPKDANPGSSGRPGSGTTGGGGYQGYGGNSGSYEGRMEPNRYMAPQNAGGGYPSYGSSGYSGPGYGYGPNNGMGYGYGNYGGASYGGPASGAYASPNAPSAGYGGPPSGQRGASWGSQAPAAYGYGGSQWGNPNAGGGNSGPNTAAAGYGSQGYGYGGYGGAEGAYGAVGGRVGGGGAPSGDGGYVGRGYGDGWQSDPSQVSGSYGGGYGGGAQTRQAPQQ